jgi:hypothetical protein
MLWLARRNRRSLLAGDLVSAARADLEQFRDRRLFVGLDCVLEDADADAIEKEERKNTRLADRCLAGLGAKCRLAPPSFRDGGGKNRRPWWERFHETPPRALTRRVRRGSKLRFAFRTTRAFDLRLGDENIWKKVILAEVEDRGGSTHDCCRACAPSPVRRPRRASAVPAEKRCAPRSKHSAKR